jgi:hypothetical protein
MPSIITALHVPAELDQPVRLVKIAPTLDTLQSLVGGYIEAVTRDGVAAYINDEGKHMGLPTNARATSYMLDARMIFPFDLVVGDLVLVGVDADGMDTDIPAAAVDAVAAATGQPVA